MSEELVLMTLMQFPNCNRPSYIFAFCKRKVKDVNSIADSLGVTLGQLTIAIKRLIDSGDINVVSPFAGFARGNVEFEYQINKESKLARRLLRKP